MYIFQSTGQTRNQQMNQIIFWLFILNGYFFFSLYTFSGILTPSDEFQFWVEEAHCGSKQISRERAGYFKELFETIARVRGSYTVTCQASDGGA